VLSFIWVAVLRVQVKVKPLATLRLAQRPILHLSMDAID
jgi:hypothetical protein